MSGLQEKFQGMTSSSWARTASFKKRAQVVSPMHSMASCRSFPERFLQGRTFVGHEDREQAGRLGIAGIARHEVRRAWRLVPGLADLVGDGGLTFEMASHLALEPA